MKTHTWAIFVVIFATLFTSSAQILYKKGVEIIEFSFIGLATNYFLIIGLGLYFIAGIMIVLALKGGEVSVLYPIIATSYIWVALLSIYFLAESMNTLKWIGITAIIVGIVLIGFGSKRRKT